MEKKHLIYLQIASAAVLVGIVLLLAGLFTSVSYRPGIILMLVATAFAIMSSSKLKGYSFTAWVLVCASVSMLYPSLFIEWGGFKLELLIIPLTQLIMFGMGTTLSMADFFRVAKSPLPVFIGMVLQFSVMPFLGYGIAKWGGFEGEIAAGIILIGSCSGGVASNLMTYLAGGNVALSVTMTLCSTLMAPVATPLLMQLLAGTFVPINALQMMYSILNMIILPVLAGLLANKVLFAEKGWPQSKLWLAVLALASLAIVLGSLSVGHEGLGTFFSGIVLAGTLVFLIIVAKLVLTVVLGKSNNWIDWMLPAVSMTGICMVIIIIIAQTYEVLMAVGIFLLIAAMVHNGMGYLLGYWGSKGLGLFFGKIGYKLGFFTSPESRIDESKARTIAIEVGMQNGGMGSGLAIDVFKSYLAALPSNIFGTWMNISGSVLANYWKQRPLEES